MNNDDDCSNLGSNDDAQHVKPPPNEAGKIRKHTESTHLHGCIQLPELPE